MAKRKNNGQDEAAPAPTIAPLPPGGTAIGNQQQGQSAMSVIVMAMEKETGEMVPLQISKTTGAILSGTASSANYPRVGNPFLYLNATTKSLMVGLAEAINTSQLDITGSYEDLTSTAVSDEAPVDTVTNGVTDVTAISAPAASTKRSVKYLTVCNVDVIPHTVLVKLNNNGTKRVICKARLEVGDTLVITPQGINVLVSRAAGAYSPLDVCEGRLTLAIATPVPRTDQSAKATLYWTPVKGGRIALYDTTAAMWILYTFAELNISLASIASGSNYDVWAYLSAGAVTLELSAAWTNDTTRATALALQNGVPVKTGDASRRYLGTIRGSASGQTSDTVLKRFVWNMYNQVKREMRCVDATATWTWETDGWHQANAATANKVEYVCGAEDTIGSALINAHVLHSCLQSAAAVGTDAAGVGVDSTSANSAQLVQVIGNSYRTLYAIYAGNPGVGYHYLAWLEHGDADASATTFYGSQTNGVNGLSAEIFC